MADMKTLLDRMLIEINDVSSPKLGDAFVLNKEDTIIAHQDKQLLDYEINNMKEEEDK
ncbi:hypothetical protein LGQ25_002847 [Listeria monocytogenes]|nr:hypothetical protein [Listeria monocytogenes]EII0397039.1 hypothetical protein [Listeria monocytogenes]